MDFHTKNALLVLRELYHMDPAPKIHFVAIGKPLRGGTHQRVKAFVVDGLGDLRNITCHLSTLAGVKLDTSDLSMVVHRDTIMFYNIAATFPELENIKAMDIIWS